MSERDRQAAQACMAEAVRLADPDPAWPAAFEREAAALRAVLPVLSGLRIEHIGSTAVPKLRGKPIIDILVVHPDPTTWPALVAPIERLGYAFWSDNPRKDRLFFVKGLPPMGTGRTHHVHVRTPADAVAELVFRDRLRASRKLARAYDQLKAQLAMQHADDREAYTAAKGDFVRKLVAQAMQDAPRPDSARARGATAER